MRTELDYDVKKRDIFRKCFDDFDFHQIARYSEQDISRIMNEDGMIKSRRKIEAVIENARAFLQITVFSHLQACGIINDHSPQCYMYDKLVHMDGVKYIDD